MRTGLLALLDDRDGDLTEPFCNVGMLLEQLSETDRARETRRPGADDEDADLDALVDRIGRLGDELARSERRRIVGGSYRHELPRSGAGQAAASAP